MSRRGLLFEDPSSREHDPRDHLPEHPDTPERIEAIDAALADADWLGWDRRTSPAATRAELEAVHDGTLIDQLESLCAEGGGQIDDDTFVGESSYRAALHAAGGACAMVRALAAGDAELAFAMLRPSGHHAERSRAMGFCLFNNAAIAAEHAITQLGRRRVLILDWDVHHGNGTAEIFRRRTDVLYASIHQAGLYPGTGAIGDAGSGAGTGYTINLPVFAGSEGDVWLSLLEHVVLPAALRFAPDLVLISAGFDAHRDDPLGGCRLDAADFAQMACQIRELAISLDVPLGAVLEGGYDANALAACVLSTMRALGGVGEVESIAPESICTPRAASYVGRYWEL
jgi:acetoin utilization deacetylase AcuC-like enzyme